MIVVDAQGGLANRMQVIDSGIALARALGRTLHVPWVVNDACGARPEALFEPFEGDVVFTCVDTEDAVEDLIHSQAGALVIDHTVPPYPSIPNSEMHTSLGDITRLRPHAVVVIRTWARFFPNSDAFRAFVPIAALRERIDGVAAGFDATIGVHIRRTDHVDSIAASPTWAFESLMTAARERGDARSFFLATDDAAEEAHLSTRYAIRTYPKRSRDRREVEAIQDAVVDLFCLARTARIIGSCGSTFSYVAALLGDKPLDWAYDEAVL